jgi:hypothetical protein
MLGSQTGARFHEKYKVECQTHEKPANKNLQEIEFKYSVGDDFAMGL